MDVEHRRLMSFHRWPRDCPVEPVHLVQNGFYYTGIKDMVRCCRCGTELEGWEAGDKPALEHKKYSKDKTCPFIASTPDVEEASNGRTVTDAHPFGDPGAANTPNCMICKKCPKAVRFLPCYCFVVCQPCSANLQACPNCHSHIGEKQLFLEDS